MSIDQPWFYFLLLAAVLALVRVPAFAFLDEKSVAAARHSPLDGLRGLLAFSVFAFHVVVTWRYTSTGIWEPPSSAFYSLLGPLGVSAFFMITGFLFWGKLLRTQGRPGWRTLYIGRLLRIGPMYLFVVLGMLAIVAVRTGFELRDSPADLLAATSQWLALGMINTQPDLNGYPATHVLAGVTWTLFYEWVFYASLLFVAPFARGRHHLGFVVGALGACLVMKTLLGSSAAGFAALFLVGMTVASLLHARVGPQFTDNPASTLGLAAVGAIFLAPLSGTGFSGYGTAAALLLGVFFYMVCRGATLFGLLTSSAARRFGAISYSLYLLQGLVLTLVFGIAPVRTFALASTGRYWLVGLLCALLLTICASLTYRWIEQPGIALGRRLAASLDRVGTGREGGVPRVEDADGAGRGARRDPHPDLRIADHAHHSVVGLPHPGLVDAGKPAAIDGHHGARAS
jgi:peptidoglycan/LPS O-acetylase OafA/YrhL